MRALVRCLDRLISHCNRVREFTADPGCVLRISPGRVTHALSLPEGEIAPGAGALLIHYWNERMPPLPAGGADLHYALDLSRRQTHSLRLVAGYLQSADEFREARVIGGVTVLAPVGEADGGTAMIRQYGFTVLPYHSPLGRFGEFWENLFTWALMWTYAPASLRFRRLWKLRRSEFWMTREKFLKNFLR
jgi:hypothetical protein